MLHPIITLTTDYGTSDHLVGAMKGVLLKINPEVHIVDICHNVLPFDVLDGALTIGQAYRFYPPRTVHIVVVDPGVGTARRPILVTGDQHYFVAPDNGVLSVVYEKEERLAVRHITSTHYFQNPVSNTFHGRDIFAPVAAWLTKNWQTPSFGEEINDYVRFTLPKPRIANNTVKGVVMRVDTFGNLVTNLTPEDVPQLIAGGKNFKISVSGKEVNKFLQAYGQGEQGEVFALLGSSGFLEISMNRGNAARTLGAQRGSEVTLETT